MVHLKFQKTLYHFLFLTALFVTQSAEANWLDNEWGKVSANIRARLELADIKGADDAQAATLRARLGYGTKAWNGVSAFVEGEAIMAYDDKDYFDGIGSANGQSIIADPEDAEINQAYINYANDFLASNFRIGRQRIILDDARFVGNVGWRQNEQTFDAVMLQSNLGHEKLKFKYAYIWDVHRIFGDKGPSGRRDFRSSSHIANLQYDLIEQLKVTLFSYLLNFKNSAANSSSTYGITLSGKQEICSDLKWMYSGSYAYQEDQANNPMDYEAHYVHLQSSIGNADLGTIGAGYEVLGSDRGMTQFRTPLATAHKFNGWADAYLNNGGINGLRDLYLWFAPKLPFKLKGKVVLHQFRSDERNVNRSKEVDIVLSRAINKNLSVLAKGAVYDGRHSSAPVNRKRFWFEATFKY